MSEGADLSGNAGNIPEKPTGGKPEIVICIGSSCFSRGNSKNVDVAEKFMKERGIEDEVDLEICGGLCAGKCADGPNVIVNGQIFHHVDAGVMLDLLNQLFPKPE